MSNKDQNKKFIYIDRLTNRDLIEEGVDFWKILPSSASKAKNICHYYFTNKECKKGHISPRRTKNRNCLMCETSPESLNNSKNYYEEHKEEISKKSKIKHKELTKDSEDARFNNESPEKELKDLLQVIERKLTFEEYIERIDKAVLKILDSIANNDKYFLGEKCNHGHNFGNQCLRVNYKSGSKICYKCKRIRDLIDYIKNEDIRKTKGSLYYHNLDEEKKKLRIKESVERNKNNPESHKKSQKKYLKDNPEKRKETTQNYRKSHPHTVNALSSNRRAKEKKALPPWLSKKAYKKINSIFKERQKIQNETGTQYEVDHIMPIDCKTSKCCGIHVPWNLEVITLTANRKKGNKLPSSDRYTAKQQDRSEMIDENWSTN